jgi:hypothetical protein
MTLEYVRSKLNDPNLSAAEWNTLKDKETILLKRKMIAEFNAAITRSRKYQPYREVIGHALKIGTIPLGGEYFIINRRLRRKYESRSD